MIIYPPTVDSETSKPNINSSPWIRGDVAALVHIRDHALPAKDMNSTRDNVAISDLIFLIAR